MVGPKDIERNRETLLIIVERLCQNPCKSVFANTLYANGKDL